LSAFVVKLGHGYSFHLYSSEPVKEERKVPAGKNPAEAERSKADNDKDNSNDHAAHQLRKQVHGKSEVSSVRLVKGW
jgi:hypothetical protein